MSRTFRSKGHTGAKGDEFTYSLVYRDGLASGGMVTILAFNESKREPGPATDDAFPTEVGKIQVHKDALIAFAASLVRGAKASQIKTMNDMQVFGL